MSKLRGEETFRRVTREKLVVRGNTAIRTLDTTTSFLPILDRLVHCFMVSIDKHDSN